MATTTCSVNIKSLLTTEIDGDPVVGGGIQLCYTDNEGRAIAIHLTANESKTVLIGDGSQLMISVDAQNLDCPK